MLILLVFALIPIIYPTAKYSKKRGYENVIMEYQYLRIVCYLPDSETGRSEYMRWAQHYGISKNPLKLLFWVEENLGTHFAESRPAKPSQLWIKLMPSRHVG